MPVNFSYPVALQYPNQDAYSLHRTVVQIKQLLEDPQFYNDLSQGIAGVAYESLAEEFVNRTGDTMTGDLKLEASSGDPKLDFDRAGTTATILVGSNGNLSLYPPSAGEVRAQGDFRVYQAQAYIEGSSGTIPKLTFDNPDATNTWALDLDDASLFRIFSGGAGQYYRFEVVAGLPNGNSVATKTRGDTRWTVTSSSRFKETPTRSPVTEHPVPDQPGRPNNRTREVNDLVGTVDQFMTDYWTWGGDIPATEEKYGTQGFGLVAEDVEAVFPQAVTYQWVMDADGNPTAEKRVLGLDPGALIALLVEEIKDLRIRVAELEPNAP